MQPNIDLSPSRTSRGAESLSSISGSREPAAARTSYNTDIAFVPDHIGRGRGADPENPSLLVLWSAVTELFEVLSGALQDDPARAQECLQRTATLLGRDSVSTSFVAKTSPMLETTGRSRRAGLAPWQVRRVTGYIEVNLERPMRTEELAGLARLSPYYFSVAFRASLGDSPHSYVIRRRMERAQGLMLSTDASLAQIAVDCGLADQAHLSRLFRKTFGETPAAWRRAREVSSRSTAGKPLTGQVADSPG